MSIIIGLKFVEKNCAINWKLALLLAIKALNNNVSKKIISNGMYCTFFLFF